MSSEFISLITSLVFAGAIFYLVQRIRHTEKELERVGRISVQTLTIDDVNTICQRKIKQYDIKTQQQEEENRQDWPMENPAKKQHAAHDPAAAHSSIEEEDSPFENDE